MNSKREFVGRHGLPANYIFKGQYFDAGHQSKMRCSVCGADLRFCYILKEDTSDRPTPSPRKLTIGQECFRFFEGETLDHLKAAAVLLENAVEAEARDKKIFAPLVEVRERKEVWSAMKRKALDVIREYRRKTGKEWLPESLFDLMVIAEQKPAAYVRVTTTAKWYERQTEAMQEKLKTVTL